MHCLYTTPHRRFALFSDRRRISVSADTSIHAFAQRRHKPRPFMNETMSFGFSLIKETNAEGIYTRHR